MEGREQRQTAESWGAGEDAAQGYLFLPLLRYHFLLLLQEEVEATKGGLDSRCYSCCEQDVRDRQNQVQILQQEALRALEAMLRVGEARWKEPAHSTPGQ